MTNPKVEEIVSAYRHAATAHLDATIKGKARVADSYVQVLGDCYRELRQRGELSKTVFLSLLNDSNEDVRLWAATHALEFASQSAELVLVELEASGSSGIVRTNAHFTLEVWHNGTLNFP